jgi:3-oxoacyl-[acyl-carrier protein] reductase
VRHVAIVTGANHGIGAATAKRLAASGVSVVVTSWRVPVDDNTGTPAQYNVNRLRVADETVDEISREGGSAAAIEADLLQPQSPARIFDLAEATFGPVDILVNNATGWACGDSFVPGRLDGAGRTMAVITADVFDRTFGVDAKASALLMAEFSRRLLARGGNWGRIPHLGRPARLPERGHLRRRQSGPGELHPVSRQRAGQARRHRQPRAPAGD